MLRTTVLFLALALSSIAASAQTLICQADWGYDDLCNLELRNGQIIYSENGNFPEVVMSYDGTRVYAGATMFGSNCAYTIFGDNVFFGASTMNTEIAYTVVNDRIYRGNSFNDADCIWTIYGGVVYRGSSTSSTDQMFKVYDDSGEMTNHLLACILSAYE